MSDGEALFRAILADPADDVPRLIYADWLDEQGQSERAEFIRAQIDLVPLDTKSNVDPHVRRFSKQGKRERRLWQRAADDDENWFCIPGWRYESEHNICLLTWIAPDASEILGAVRRGFVHGVNLTMKRWLDHGPTLLRHQPIGWAELRGREPHHHNGRGESWTWFRDWQSNRPSAPCEIHPDIYAHLPEGEAGNVGTAYESRELALAALSHAALASAREQSVIGVGDLAEMV